MEPYSGDMLSLYPEGDQACMNWQQMGPIDTQLGADSGEKSHSEAIGLISHA